MKIHILHYRFIPIFTKGDRKTHKISNEYKIIQYTIHLSDIISDKNSFQITRSDHYAVTGK
jgi:hypothetical protein